MFTLCPSTLGRPAAGILLVLVAAMATAIPAAPASAQGLFDFFFGAPRRSSAPPPSASSYADPYPSYNPYGSRQAEPERRGDHGPAVAYCVRLCDGRFFPIQRASGANPAQVCNSFCPAARTKVFSGGGIDHAVASDGARYADLPTAFVYRARMVADCTCNGKDSVGLVTTTAADDPTLRAGDIVATDNGFVAYSGGRRQNAEFTPIESWVGSSAQLRQRLAGVRIVPRNATPVPVESNDDNGTTATADPRSRVQLDR